MHTHPGRQVHSQGHAHEGVPHPAARAGRIPGGRPQLRHQAGARYCHPATSTAPQHACQDRQGSPSHQAISRHIPSGHP
eukprot:4733292-Pyramimonas_sp.AAC.1